MILIPTGLVFILCGTFTWMVGYGIGEPLTITGSAILAAYTTWTIGWRRWTRVEPRHTELSEKPVPPPTTTWD
jgi:hypothetical protein